MKINVVILSLIVLMTGCSTQRVITSKYNPISESKDLNFQEDVADCRKHSIQLGNPDEATVDGVFAGALVGAQLTAQKNTRSRYSEYRNNDLTEKYVAIGSLIEGSGSVMLHDNNERDVVRRCLISRGHNILN